MDWRCQNRSRTDETVSCVAKVHWCCERRCSDAADVVRRRRRSKETAALAYVDGARCVDHHSASFRAEGHCDFRHNTRRHRTRLARAVVLAQHRRHHIHIQFGFDTTVLLRKKEYFCIIILFIFSDFTAYETAVLDAAVLELPRITCFVGAQQRRTDRKTFNYQRLSKNLMAGWPTLFEQKQESFLLYKHQLSNFIYNGGVR